VSALLADERGACPDAADYGVAERFSNKLAIAPTASISIICGNSSPGIEPYAANSFMQKTLSGSFNVRNKNLAKLLTTKGRNDDETWSSITVNEGSVQHLDFLDEHEKLVFKTAFELDQRWLIEHAADRTPYVCQAQSLNVFLPANVHKKDLHDIHYLAWKKGVKSLYYCRSKSLQRSEVVAVGGAAPTVAMAATANNSRQLGLDLASSAPHANSNQLDQEPMLTENTPYEECLACQ
jgi:ribonucleoside-diphosphate reductase alpha chain